MADEDRQEWLRWWFDDEEDVDRWGAFAQEVVAVVAMLREGDVVSFGFAGVTVAVTLEDRADPAGAAARVVARLRDEHGCLDPTFLAVEGAELASCRARAEARLASGTESAAHVHHPRGADEVTSLLAGTLVQLRGPVLVRAGALEVASDACRLVATPVVDDVRGSAVDVELALLEGVPTAAHDRAAREVARRNDDASGPPLGHLVLRGDRVVLRYASLALCLDRIQLRLTLGVLLVAAEEQARQLAALLGGTVCGRGPVVGGHR